MKKKQQKYEKIHMWTCTIMSVTSNDYEMMEICLIIAVVVDL